MLTDRQTNKQTKMIFLDVQSTVAVSGNEILTVISFPTGAKGQLRQQC